LLQLRTTPWQTPVLCSSEHHLLHIAADRTVFRGRAFCHATRLNCSERATSQLDLCFQHRVLANF